MARGPKPQIGASVSALTAYIRLADSNIYNSFAILESLSLRDSMYQKFKINRSELSTLLSLHGLLIANDQVLISRNKFVQHLTGNFKTKHKIAGYIAGLFTLKAIDSFEYTKRPGSLSIGITDFGFEILRSYWMEMNELFTRYVPKGKQAKKLASYPDLSEDTKSISIVENIPLNYRVRQANH